MTRGQQRIVGRHRTGTHQDRVAQGTQPVHVDDVVAARDGLRVAGRRGDEAVEALAEVANRQRTRGRRAADGQIQAQQL